MSVAEALGWGYIAAIHGCIGFRVDGHSTQQWKSQ